MNSLIMVIIELSLESMEPFMRLASTLERGMFGNGGLRGVGVWGGGGGRGMPASAAAAHSASCSRATSSALLILSMMASLALGKVEQRSQTRPALPGEPLVFFT